VVASIDTPISIMEPQTGQPSGRACRESYELKKAVIGPDSWWIRPGSLHRTRWFGIFSVLERMSGQARRARMRLRRAG